MPTDRFVPHVALSDDETDAIGGNGGGGGVTFNDTRNVSEHILAKCSNCSAKLCDGENEWIKVTGSYFLEAHPQKHGKVMAVTGKGEVRPGGVSSRLEGW